MKERTITDDEFINITVKVMNEISIVDDAEIFKAYSILFSSMVCTEIFGDPEEEEHKEFKKIVSYADGNGYTFNIYTGGIIKNYCATVEVHNKIIAKQESENTADCYKFFCDYTLTKVD